ncbi:MAG: hypothetical protein RML32_08810 [Gammaproteobacteria bacterium]|nr:hypothetical protein [Gammaproteobacteria bacterium]
MRTLTIEETVLAFGAGDNVWYEVGRTVGRATAKAYNEAVKATTNFFEWVDSLDGSLSD